MSKALSAVERIALQVKAKSDKAREDAKTSLAHVDKEVVSVINSIAYNQPGYKL
jgi:hypothetical protein